jgi:hypothetical protein
MQGIEERKIGNTVFLVFENGMVSADDVEELRLDGDGKATIMTKAGGWLSLRLLA